MIKMPAKGQKQIIENNEEAIFYKGVIHNVLQDAPFIGAVLIANGCTMPCRECINEHLKSEDYSKAQRPQEIIDKVVHNKLDQGVIFSGLEWSEQPKDLMRLVNEALKNKLKVMIYTHHEEESFFEILPQLQEMDVFIKFGLYDAAQKSDNYFSQGVQLASTNQYIKKFGRDE